MTTSRLEAFSDGVFAVAITLLVLQFVDPVAPSGKLLARLLGQWPQLATYGASFLTIGVIWVNHHTIFKGIREIDRTIQFINLVLLLMVVLVPYPTEHLVPGPRRLGRDASAPAAAGGQGEELAVGHPSLWPGSSDLCGGHRARLRQRNAGGHSVCGHRDLLRL